MDYAALKAEIALPVYVGMTDAQIAAALKAKTVAGRDRLVPVIEITKYLRENNLWLPIKAAAGTNTGAAAAVDYNADPRTETMDVSLPIVGAMLAQLVSAALLTQAQSDAIVAMKSTTRRYLETIGWLVDVTEHDIAAARTL